NGQKDPLVENPKARIMYNVFRTSATPFPEYDPKKPSPLFKVNQVGYLPDAPKFAYLGAWLGPVFGPWRPHAPMKEWELVDAATGEAVLRRDGNDAPLLRVPDANSKEGAPFTGEDTYELDFSSVTNEGVFFVRVPGVGRSIDFRIAAHAAEDAFRVHMGGLYQKRCGIAKTEPFTHWTAGPCHTRVVRGSFPPGEGSLVPGASWFEILRDNTDWSMAERLVLPGGWHDAADYDRRPAHLNIVNDLCAVYLMRPANFADGQLRIPENANGIPDILDEAEWGLRHLLVGQRDDGGVGTWIESVAHPVPGNVAETDRMPYVLSRPTRRSSLMFAAHAAILARCHPSFRAKYLDPAIRAWDFALHEAPQTDIFGVKYHYKRIFPRTEIVYWDEDPDLPAEYLLKAAINLSALTDDPRYLNAAVSRSKEFAATTAANGWKHIPLLFAGERALGCPNAAESMLSAWEKKKLETSKSILRQIESAYAYRAPWWAPQQGWVHTMGFGNAHPLVRAQYLVLAHLLSGDPKYLDAISIANDFHNGCNPQGSTLTSGLGSVYPVAFLDLPSYVDGIAEFVPGITPFRWTYTVPQKVVELVFGGNRARASLWPIWRRWGNLENQTVNDSEYTVWETIAPAAAVTGYLLSPSGEPPPPQRQPASDIRDLPGYWALP
ncbi:MAG: glycoside hydrolase family 9 protein, partial [Kiritimatiellae bacterium]|nr:glycoside hydrolase family 9 protein [Kiritimatiellia bacterium]